MTYIISDIHGQYDKYRAMLELIEFGSEDILYVLGDVIDRGPQGFKILLDMQTKMNIIPLVGNHEFMAAQSMKWLMKEVTDDTLKDVTADLMQGLLEWMQVGGSESIAEFRSLTREEQESILEYLREFSIAEEVEVGGKQFVLVHAGLENFAEDRDLWDYSLHETIFAETDYRKVYFRDKYLVTGHRPVRAIHAEMEGKDINQLDPSQYNDTLFMENNHISIDCGCGYGGKLGCICLDTFRTFYV